MSAAGKGTVRRSANHLTLLEQESIFAATGLAERLVEVGAEVLHVFEPQGEPEEVLPYAQLLPDRRGDGLGGARQGVVEQGLRAPQARRGLDKLDLLQDVDGLLLPTLHLEAQYPAVEPPLEEELVRYLAIRAVLEAWVVHGLD